MSALAGKTALIIGGGGGGIGRAITRAFAAAGGEVAVADVDRARAKEAASEVNGIALAGDVCSLEDVQRLVTEAASRLARLDVLVTVVGGQLAFVQPDLLHEMPDEDWDLMFELNLRWVARAVRVALRVFMGQGEGGTIVSVGSKEVAQAAVFLASDRSSYITGQSIVLDGGATAAGPFPTP